MLRTLFVAMPLLLLVNAPVALALPPCPGIYAPNTWHDCQGTYEHEDAFRYVGEFKNGKYHGQGTSTLMVGDKYVGEWKDGRKHGRGTIFLAYGDVWIGQWKTGEWVSGEKYSKEAVPPEVYKFRD